jgi:hypothetical protein
MGPGLICEHRPELALLMMAAINGWSATEYQVGRFLATILGEDASPVIQKAIRSRSTSKNRQLLLVHARQRLGDDELILLEAVVELAKEVSNQRNPLAHWLSGYAPRLTNAILLLNPEDKWNYDASMGQFIAKVRREMRSYETRASRWTRSWSTAGLTLQLFSSR